MSLTITESVPVAVTFEDDGTFPNSRYPVLIYMQVLQADGPKAATQFEKIFKKNDWTEFWRGGIFPFSHYHSTAHEVLAVYSGSASLLLGGPDIGQPFNVSSGDVIVIPAGVAHQNLGSTDDLGVVGAFAGGRKWDLLKGEAGDRSLAIRHLAGVPRPANDPLFGDQGPLAILWGHVDT